MLRKKSIFKSVPYSSMPLSILFIFRKRLNFIFLLIYLVLVMFTTFL